MGVDGGNKPVKPWVCAWVSCCAEECRLLFLLGCFFSSLPGLLVLFLVFFWGTLDLLLPSVETVSPGGSLLCVIVGLSIKLSLFTAIEVFSAAAFSFESVLVRFRLEFRLSTFSLLSGTFPH